LLSLIRAVLRCVVVSNWFSSVSMMIDRSRFAAGITVPVHKILTQLNGLDSHAQFTRRRLICFHAQEHFHTTRCGTSA
jgi:hypothetical protein